MVGDGKKVESCVLLLLSSFFHFWGHLGGKGDMEARDMRAQRKCGWLVEGCWGGAPKLDCRWPKCRSDGEWW